MWRCTGNPRCKSILHAHAHVQLATVLRLASVLSNCSGSGVWSKSATRPAVGREATYVSVKQDWPCWWELYWSECKELMRSYMIFAWVVMHLSMSCPTSQTPPPSSPTPSLPHPHPRYGTVGLCIHSLVKYCRYLSLQQLLLKGSKMLSSLLF